MSNMSIDKKNVFLVNRGSDLEFRFNWPDGTGGNLNLTDYVIDGYEVDPDLKPHLTLEIESATGGLIRGLVNWDESMPSYREMGFRIRITKGELNTTTNILKVSYR